MTFATKSERVEGVGERVKQQYEANRKGNIVIFTHCENIELYLSNQLD